MEHHQRLAHKCADTLLSIPSSFTGKKDVSNVPYLFFASSWRWCKTNDGAKKESPSEGQGLKPESPPA